MVIFLKEGQGYLLQLFGMIKCVIDSSFPKKIKRTVQLNDILIRSIKHDDSYYFHEDSKDYYKLK